MFYLVGHKACYLFHTRVYACPGYQSGLFTPGKDIGDDIEGGGVGVVKEDEIGEGVLVKDTNPTWDVGK